MALLTDDIYYTLATCICENDGGYVILLPQPGKPLSFRIVSDVSTKVVKTGVTLNGYEETYLKKTVNSFSCEPVGSWDSSEFDLSRLKEKVNEVLEELSYLDAASVGPGTCIYSNGHDYIKLSK